MVKKNTKVTYKFLVMDQDGLLVCVDVVLDDVAVSVAEQQLITCQGEETG